MKSATVLLVGFLASFIHDDESQAGDHLYFHHTQSSAAVQISPPCHAWCVDPANGYSYAPYAYVAPAAYPYAYVAPAAYPYAYVAPAAYPIAFVAAPQHAIPVAPATWSCCPPRYRRVWPSHVYIAPATPADVRVDYKYGLSGRIKGFTIRY